VADCSPAFFHYPITPVFHICGEWVLQILSFGNLNVRNDLVVAARLIGFVEQVACFLPLGLPFGPVVGNEPLDVIWHRTAVWLAVLLRIDQRAKFDQMGHRIQVDSVSVTSQP